MDWPCPGEPAENDAIRFGQALHATAHDPCGFWQAPVAVLFLFLPEQVQDERHRILRRREIDHVQDLPRQAIDRLACGPRPCGDCGQRLPPSGPARSAVSRTLRSRARHMKLRVVPCPVVVAVVIERHADKGDLAGTDGIGRLKRALRVAHECDRPQVLAGLQPIVEERARARAADRPIGKLQADDVVFAAVHDGIDEAGLRVEMNDRSGPEVLGATRAGSGTGGLLQRACQLHRGSDVASARRSESSWLARPLPLLAAFGYPSGSVAH